jgi:hypothetical protein
MTACPTDPEPACTSTTSCGPTASERTVW